MAELQRLARELAAENDLARILQHLCFVVRRLLDAKGSAVRLVEESDRLPGHDPLSAFDADDPNIVLNPPVNLDLLLKGVPDLAPVTLDDARTIGAAERGANHCFLGIRLGSPAKLYGILYVVGKERGDSFTENDAAVLSTVAELVMTAYEAALQRGTFRGLETADQMERVSDLERERRRIALVLHGELGQDVTAIKIGLQLLARRLGDEQSRFSEDLRSLSGITEALIENVRHLATELHPPWLNLGIGPALHAYAKDFEARSKIHCEVKIHGEEIALDAPRKTVVYRVIQECLTNVARHAMASVVEVVLAVVGGKLILEVRDNGRGFSSPPSPYSMGLLGMREHVAPFGGQVKVESSNVGTKIVMTLPYICASGSPLSQ